MTRSRKRRFGCMIPGALIGLVVTVELVGAEHGVAICLTPVLLGAALGAAWDFWRGQQRRKE